MPTGGSSSKSSKPKPSEVAAEAKKQYIPLIKKTYAHTWKTCSLLYEQPLQQLIFQEHPATLSQPMFEVLHDDPVEYTLRLNREYGTRAAFICAANEKRPGGDWETAVQGVEERLCRRSTLSATLGTPDPQTQLATNYPIPIGGGIYSHEVVVFRGPHEHYKAWPPEKWQVMSVCSVPPQRWPKLTNHGAKYSFDSEREIMREKLRGAVRICVFNDVSTLVIGDFGLGNAYRNPPQELAELWREVFLYDPDLRGRVTFVAFVFEDATQSTHQLILDDIARKARPSGGSSSSSSSRSKSKSSSSGSPSSNGRSAPTDLKIFENVFNAQEIARVVGQPDARYGIDMLTI